MKRIRHANATIADERHEQAFSLVELLVVLAILTIIMSMVVPAVTSLLSSTNLAQGGETVFDQIAVARQYASTRNITTEVRLIKINSVSNQGYSALQLWTSGTGGAMSPVGKMVYLPQAVAVSENTTALSRMLSFLTVSGSMAPGGAASNAPYVSFSIRPSGAVSPVITGTDRSNLYLTVVPARLAGAATISLPPNYATIQINPDTGNALLIRP